MCHDKEVPDVHVAREHLEKKVSREDVQVGPYDAKTRLLKLMNGGSFGQIFLGESVNTGNKVAVKIEHPGQIEQLLYEGQVYRKLQGGPGIPDVTWYGMHGSMFNALVMELLGPSLQDLFVENNKKFSLKTVLLLIDQMIDTIQFMHERDFVHRDISSNNFMTGLGANSDKLYLIDFGLAKKFRSSPGFGTGKRGFTFRYARPMVGTARFCSTFCQKGEEEARRDDMESLGFLWIYLLQGHLPWQGLHVDSHSEKMEKIYSLKLTTPLTELCEGLPEEFSTYLTFVRGMSQYDMPNYEAIKQMFRGVAKREGIEYDFVYDWSSTNVKGLRTRGMGEKSSSEDSLRETAPTDPNGEYLKPNVRTISTCSSSSPSDGIVSH